MLETHPHVKYIRICERINKYGERVQALIIDTDLEIISVAKEALYKDLRLVDLAANIKEFQIVMRKKLGKFSIVEVTGSQTLLLD